MSELRKHPRNLTRTPKPIPDVTSRLICRGCVVGLRFAIRYPIVVGRYFSFEVADFREWDVSVADGSGGLPVTVTGFLVLGLEFSLADRCLWQRRSAVLSPNGTH